MATADQLGAAITTNTSYVRKVTLSVSGPLAQRLEPYLSHIDSQAFQLVASATVSGDAAGDPAPANPAPDPSWFVPIPEGDPIYLEGGTAAGNPNGVSWTVGQAIAWFTYVYENAVDYHEVRPTLLPGSHCLTPAGIDFFQHQYHGTVVAPEDFNPLGLPVIP